MKIDLHIHSIASGHALNTVDEISAYAEKCGMTHIAITDHGPAMEGAPHGGYFEVSEMVSPKRNDLKIYMGIEANILDLEGTIDLHDPYYSMQKIISAGIHEKTGFSGNSLQDNTEALLAVIKKEMSDYNTSLERMLSCGHGNCDESCYCKWDFVGIER